MKAIETRYKGYRFRSRLEARWAVFFENIKRAWPGGFSWEYEPEGFDIGNGNLYLPDFKINYGVHFCYVEIKGEKPTNKEFEKGKNIAFQTKKPFYFLCGIPDPDDLICGCVTFNGWCFIPANCDFVLRDAQFAMFDYYRTELPEFLNCDPLECFGEDNKYHLNKRGAAHPHHCAMGRMQEIGVEPPFFMQACKKNPEETIRRSCIAARSARFEHGETP